MEDTLGVDKYMANVTFALEASGLTGQARTNVYNRAWEAVAKALRDSRREVASANTVAATAGMDTFNLKEWVKKHRSTVLYALGRIARDIHMDGETADRAKEAATTMPEIKE